MRAIVLLGGGEDSRLRPLTYSIPKPMLPVAGKPMVTRTIEWLARSGVDQVVVSLGNRPDAFSEAFPDSTCAGVQLTYAVEPEPLDTAGGDSVRGARRWGNERTSQVVCNGDVLTDLDLVELVAISRGGTGAEGARST